MLKVSLVKLYKVTSEGGALWPVWRLLVHKPDPSPRSICFENLSQHRSCHPHSRRWFFIWCVPTLNTAQFHRKDNHNPSNTTWGPLHTAIFTKCITYNVLKEPNVANHGAVLRGSLQISRFLQALWIMSIIFFQSPCLDCVEMYKIGIYTIKIIENY